MLTSFSLSQLILISTTYLLTLFGVAWAAEHGWVPRKSCATLWSIYYLGVYASAWAFFGAVGLAYQYGYGFLAIYLGLSGAFVSASISLPFCTNANPSALILGGLAGFSLSQQLGGRH